MLAGPAGGSRTAGEGCGQRVRPHSTPCCRVLKRLKGELGGCSRQVDTECRNVSLAQEDPPSSCFTPRGDAREEGQLGARVCDEPTQCSLEAWSRSRSEREECVQALPATQPVLAGVSPTRSRWRTPGLRRRPRAVSQCAGCGGDDRTCCRGCVWRGTALEGPGTRASTAVCRGQDATWAALNHFCGSGTDVLSLVAGGRLRGDGESGEALAWG